MTTGGAIIGQGVVAAGGAAVAGGQAQNSGDKARGLSQATVAAPGDKKAAKPAKA